MEQREFEPKNCFERLYNKPLSEREVFEMRDSLRQFFEILMKVDKRNKERSNDKNKRNTNNTDQTE